MQIDCIELFHVGLPFAQPQETPAGTLDTLETVLVRVQSGRTSGWGEASPGNAPLGGPEWAAGAFGCLRDWLAPAVTGTTVDSGSDLAQRLEAFRGNRFAKAALDMAWWDLRARLEDKPLHQLLGARRETIELGATFDQMDSFDGFLAAIGRALEDGYARVKVKVRPGWDERMLDAVRKEFPVAMLYGDCEAALGLQHMDLLCRFDDFGLDLLEQPLAPDDLVGHAMVQDSVRTPICLDESITTLERVEMALDLKSCQFINLKPGRAGGLTSCLAILEACQPKGVGCYVGAVPQSALGARFGWALSALDSCTLPADFFPTDRLLRRDLAEPLSPQRDTSEGTLRIALWPQPGIGIEPNMELLEETCIARASV